MASMTRTLELAPPAAQAIGAVTARGAFWTIALSLLNKAVAFGCQISLAYFLLPKDYGLVAMAVSATSIAGLVSGMNVKGVLFKKLDQFEENLGQAFWLS